MFDDDKPPLNELAHHGIKGQKWGVRRNLHPGEGGSSGESSGGKATPRARKDVLSPDERAILDYYTKEKGVSSDTLQAKFEPQSIKGKASAPRTEQEARKQGLQNLENERKGLTPTQRKLIIAGGAAALVAGLAIYGHYEGKKLPTNQDFWKNYAARSMTRQQGLSKEAVAAFSREDQHYSAGYVFKRLSSKNETTIRPEGFFAAADDADLDNYKAILPVFWKQWGVANPDGGGHIINVAAKNDIKVMPAGKVYDYFRKNVEDPSFRDEYDLFGMLGSSRNMSSSELDDFALKHFPSFSANWVNPMSSNTPKFFDYLKENGYNAAVDTNDMGVLSKNPIRMMNGADFSISHTEPLTPSVIKQYQDSMSAKIKSSGGVQKVEVPSFREKFKAARELQQQLQDALNE